LRNSVGVASIGLSVQVAQATPTSLKRLLGLTGYTILQAESLAAAAEMAKGCPVLSSGGSVEVLPVM
jgi:hypothetical protein